ncbi:MAG: NAD(P)-dependent dehydrogenase (short-subunit alcohol dehydrogenase family) [Myxococcota bacterium]|jgi:NAD(P)-dependent dehydrogenase (short-subunit alcohol dehydrogenase family)
MILEGKTIVVCGVGPGLGREVAQAALRDGANVVIGARNEKKLQAIAAELDPSGERVVPITVDITDTERCTTFLDTAAERFGQVDAVVQVAAFDTQFGTLATTTEEDWKTCLNANVIGTMRIAKAALPHLKNSGGGSIVLVGSQSMWLSPPMPQLAYASSKGALVSSMYHLAEELGPDKIRVNMVIPTWMWGPPVESYVKWQANEQGVSEQQVIDGITANMPLGEIPKDDDVAEAIIFFCSNRSRMITGETLLVNAGEIMR